MNATEADRAYYLAEVDRLKADYDRACSTIITLTPFYDSCCVLAPGARVQAMPLYERYTKWHGSTRPSSPLMSQRAFSQQIQNRFAVEHKRHTTYLGIAIRAEGAAVDWGCPGVDERELSPEDLRAREEAEAELEMAQMGGAA